jgi:hypothetical protein
MDAAFSYLLQVKFPTEERFLQALGNTGGGQQA